MHRGRSVVSCMVIVVGLSVSACDPGSAVAGQLLNPREDAATPEPDAAEPMLDPNPILCGGAYESPCAPHKYCAFDTGCGTVGYCTPKERSCAEKQPVCGCDGQTYESECAAAALGIGLNHEGECGDGAAQLSCGRFVCDGAFYCLDKGAQPEGSNEERYVCVPFPEGCSGCSCERELDRACYLGSSCEDESSGTRVICAAPRTGN